MRQIYSLLAAAAVIFMAAAAVSAKEHTLHVVTTGDVHGSWFDRSYVDDYVPYSLMHVNRYVDSLRNAVGSENVLLLDAGDCLQGNNASYYYNYVETAGEHLFPRLVDYMGYDAIIVGNHDIETGHEVYDKVNAELAERGIPWLGGNAVRTDDGQPYFPIYATFDRAGLKVAVLGFTNANMKAWLGEELWSGMDFLSLVPYVQDCVDDVIAEEKPDVTVVVVHSGTGDGDGSMLESQGLDLLGTLEGVDLLVCSHDHRPAVVKPEDGGAVLLNGGSHARRVGHAVIDVDKRGRKLKAKDVTAEVVNLDWRNSDSAMQKAFDSEYQTVREFTNRPIGRLDVELRSRDAYAGMSDYINLVHTVQLKATGAQISFAAPLSFDGVVEPGTVIYNDAFTIYPYENDLYVMKLKGSEIKNYLEYSYDSWIQTPGEHVLSLADGSEFDPNQWYSVAMTSYRASGGGNLIFEGAGVSRDELDFRIQSRHSAIRDMVTEFISSHDTVSSETVSDPALLGEWHFIPEEEAAEMIEEDMKLIF